MELMPTEPDEVLFARIVRGDVAAFDPLYERYESRLFGFLVARLGNRADAEELFHESFVRTLKSGARLDRDGAFRTYIFRVARNLALNRKRSEKRGARAMERMAGEEIVETSAHDRLADEQLRRALDAAVDKLPSALSELFHLRCSGLSYEEMASVLEVPLGTVKSRMNQMVGHLREELKPWTAG
jgi:RNA polymerase sigma-70 factor (ECF subfamily)